MASVDGPKGHYLVYTNQLTVGRQSAGSSPEIDLSLEGDAAAVSRRQALLRRDAQTSTWSIQNVGRASFLVNGVSVPSGGSSDLVGKSLLVIGGIRLIFDELVAH